jgi:hypothetical protein
MRLAALLPLALLSVACTTSPPKNVSDVCEIFRDKRGWYEDAADARQAWGSSIPVMMAMMHQESRFQAKARPPRRWFLGFIPGPRPSDAYGYSQALGSTWATYQRKARRRGADRDDFADAIDFIGWYNDQSHRHCGIPRSDAYRLYLAYHEGHGGYNRGSYRGKAWLQRTARRVEYRAQSYARQISACEKDLQDDGWFFGWF